MDKRNLSPVDSSDKTARGLVVFDGFCVLCSASVKFLLKIDKNKILQFTTLRTPSSSNGDENTEIPSTVIYMENNQVYTESEALVQLLKRIGGMWGTIAAMLRIIPRKWRDYLYRLIATHRYRIFGKKKQCFIAPEKFTDRFIQEIDVEEIKAFKSKG